MEDRYNVDFFIWNWKLYHGRIASPNSHVVWEVRKSESDEQQTLALLDAVTTRCGFQCASLSSASGIRTLVKARRNSGWGALRQPVLTPGTW